MKAALVYEKAISRGEKALDKTGTECDAGEIPIGGGSSGILILDPNGILFGFPLVIQQKASDSPVNLGILPITIPPGGTFDTTLLSIIPIPDSFPGVSLKGTITVTTDRGDLTLELDR